ncbi:MAG: mechanosensitive ion channel [Gammaproteobacteria bacterium]|nr:mechanosensitive ion channel [Gammaproteobacteria bacterium]
MMHSLTRNPLMLFIILAMLLPAVAPAQEDVAVSADDLQLQDTINTLHSLIKLQTELKNDIHALGQQLAAAKTVSEKKDIQAQLDKLDADLQTTTRNLRGIGAGADIASLRAAQETKFSLQEELFALLKPALKEMKDMTSHVRLKSELKDKIAYYREKQPVAELAVANIMGLIDKNEDESLERYLEGMLADWRKQLTVIQSELQSAELQLEKLERSEASLADASQSYLKAFFQRRGLYLAQAILAVMGVLLLSRMSYRAMVKLIPGYRQEHRSFRIRLLDLVHRIITVILAIMGPMVVFYLVEDWVLFSLGILLLLGIGLTLRHALPRYWQQVQLFLNVGSVREGERLDLDGLPWRVRQINIFSLLENPTAGLSQRVRIDDLVELKSRPVKQSDPWFPCKCGDWVQLSDGMRGKVTGISQELVELIERGGAHCTYRTADFLVLSPNNLSRNFRLKETIGISYDLQRESVAAIPDTLKDHIKRRATEEGYADRLHNLRVDFEKANASSLDIVVIADFDGALADLYGRLQRTLQRWCVEACNEFGWEIPFTQLTLHQTEAANISVLP